MTRSELIGTLERAGETLLSLPQNTRSGRLSMADWSPISNGPMDYSNIAARPSPDRISEMEAALAWIALIPDNKYVLRRIVASRMLVSPITGRHLFPWRRLATLLGADYAAIKRWHGQGIDLILDAIRTRSATAGEATP